MQQILGWYLLLTARVRMFALVVCGLVTLSSCGLPTWAAGGRALDDVVFLRTRDQARAVVIFSHNMDFQQRSALAFAGPDVTRRTYAAWRGGMEHAQVAFTREGTVAFATVDELITVTDRVQRTRRSVPKQQSGAIGRPYALPDGEFAFYFNVGFDKSPADYRTRFEYLSGRTSDEVPGVGIINGQCRPGLVAGVAWPGATDPGLRGRLSPFRLDASGVQTLPPLSPEYSPSLLDDTVPCVGDKLPLLHTPRTDLSDGGAHRLSLIDVNTGQRRVVPLSFPKGEPLTKPDDPANNPISMTVADDQLVWVASRGQVYSTSTRTGATRRLTHLAPDGVDGDHITVMDASDGKLFIYDKPLNRAGEIRVYDALTGAISERFATPAVDAAVRGVNQHAFPTGIALRGA